MQEKEYKDGFYGMADAKEALCNHFVSEKELCDYIELNMPLFCKDVLGVELKGYKREYALTHTGRRSKGSRRVDFLIATTCGQVIAVECKDPHYEHSELTTGVGQLMSYICMFEMIEQKVDRYILVSTKLDFIVPLLIKRFGLPIEFIGMDKDKHLTLVNQ